MTLTSLTLLTTLLVPASGGPNRTFEITLTNVSHGIVLTPPIFSLSPQSIALFELGEPASPALEQLAEGGATGPLRTDLEATGVQDVVETTSAVGPGESITVLLDGTRFSKLNLASMLLPTNDAFIAVNGQKMPHRHRTTVLTLRAYDAGTEVNDELCDHIPGPQCGGEGSVGGGGEGFVVPHAGIHGEGDLARSAYAWGDPVAIVRIRVVD